MWVVSHAPALELWSEATQPRLLACATHWLEETTHTFFKGSHRMLILINPPAYTWNPANSWSFHESNTRSNHLLIFRILLIVHLYDLQCIWQSSDNHEDGSMRIRGEANYPSLREIRCNVRRRINVSECHLQSWSEYYKVSIHNTCRGLMIPPFPADGLSSR